MKNLKIKILIGIPASGKSTWATNFIRNNPDWVRVNRDSFRLMLRNENMCDPKVEDLITKLVDEVIYKSLMKKLNVIIDNTNVKAKYINQFIEKFKYYADIEYQVFDISLEKAIERDKNREAKVGEEVIRRMYNDYKILMDSFDFQPVNKVGPKPFVQLKRREELPDCVIFDLDGTIAQMNGKRGPFDWHNVHRDEINETVCEQVEFHRSKGRKIIIMSGRDEVSKKLTEEWLELYDIHYDEIYMRKENDYRKDYIVKRELYRNNIRDRYNVLVAYDDRHQVLQLWYEEGIFAYNVNQGNIIF